MMKYPYLWCLLVCLSFSVPAFPQSDQENEQLTHEMTASEKMRAHEIGLRFVATPPPAGPVRNIAEFEPMEAVLIRYPFGIPTALIAEMSQDCKVITIVSSSNQQTTVTNTYSGAGVNLSNCDFLIAPSNSYWTRDYGPWFVHFGDRETGIVDFPYNRPRPLDDSIPKILAAQLGIPWFGMPLIHTGGNYMTTGYGYSASTDLVISENQNLSVSQIEQLAFDYLGVDTYDLLPDPNNTYIDHIDCWGKFLAPDKVLIRSVPPTHPQYNDIENTAAYFSNLVSPYGNNFKVFRVNTPNNQPYSNSLILNKKVLVPLMNQVQYDTAALHAYQTAMPGYEVLGFTGLSGSNGWASTDALHCRTMGIADLGMLEILHYPLLGVQPLLSQYTLEATVTPYSGYGLYPDSVLLYYKVNNGSYTALPMYPSGNNLFETDIPGQTAGSVVSYYIFAADSSGRREFHPYTGPDDPHVFETGVVGTGPSIDGGKLLTAGLNVTPNPFRYASTFSFSLAGITQVNLSIYDVQGRMIRTLIDQPLGAGRHFFTWDAMNENGQRMPAGIYLGKLSENGRTTIVKLVLADN
ncbi:MAG TPA: agmatine deiminase family protein [Bacteroidales bacterium]|nr:agmatine deiminase family protein [Bacteroidales bacterium]HSA42698.1 agmatine deiminase family protein [Bacteroidales bacterium]